MPGTGSQIDVAEVAWFVGTALSEIVLAAYALALLTEWIDERAWKRRRRRSARRAFGGRS